MWINRTWFSGASALAITGAALFLNGAAAAAGSDASATAAYGESQETLTEEVDDSRSNLRRGHLEKDLQDLLLNTGYRLQHAAGEPAAGVEFLCAPQYDHRLVSDASLAIGKVRRNVNDLSKKSGLSGLRLFLYEISIEKEAEKKPDAAPKPAPISIPDETLEKLRGFEANTLRDETAKTGVCDRRFTPDIAAEEIDKRRRPEHRDACSCADAATAAAGFFLPPAQRSPIAGIFASAGAGAAFVKGVFGILDNVFGYFAQKRENARIKREVFAYLSDADTEAQFNGAVSLLKGEIEQRKLFSQASKAQDYWKAYCGYAAERARLVEVLFAEQAGAAPEASTPAPNPGPFSPDICAHVDYQDALLHSAPPAARSGGDTKPVLTPEQAQNIAIAQSHAATEQAIETLVKSAGAFDKAFDSPGGELADAMTRQYQILKKSFDPKARVPGYEMVNVVNDLLWLVDAIVIVNKGVSDFDAAWDKFMKEVNTEEKKEEKGRR